MWWVQVHTLLNTEEEPRVALVADTPRPQPTPQWSPDISGKASKSFRSARDVHGPSVSFGERFDELQTLRLDALAAMQGSANKKGVRRRSGGSDAGTCEASPADMKNGSQVCI